MPRSPLSRPAAAFALVTLLAVPTAPTLATSWPSLRGPSFDGSLDGEELLPNDGGALEVTWKRALGSGYSGTVVADGRVFTMFADGDSDILGAFDVEGGEELWRYRMGDTYVGHDGSHDGPISTPLVDGDRITVH